MTAAPADTIRVRVYYEDTDFSGNVYHAAYFRFMERGRTEFLRSRDIHHSALAAEGVAFAVTHIDVKFKAAARIDDELSVTTQVARFSGARLALAQSVLRDGTPIVEATVEVAAIKTRGGPARLPRALLASLKT